MANNAPLQDPVQMPWFNGVMLESVLLADDGGEARRQLRLAAVRRAGGRSLDVFTLDYGRAGTLDAWCDAAAQLPFLAAFVPDTTEGRALKVFPFRACGRSR